MKMNKVLFFPVVSLLLAGCWTLSETDYPDVQIQKLPAGKSLTVTVIGFDTGVYRFVPTPGHEQMLTNADDCVNGPYARENAVTNRTAGLISIAASKLIARAEIGLERKGYTIAKIGPEYVVEIKLDGPHPREYTVLKQLGLAICTLFTMEKEVSSWDATLRVYDRSRKVVLEKKYHQEYEVSVWGPIPVASPACEPKIAEHATHSWVLSALSDRAIADAAAFLADKAHESAGSALFAPVEDCVQLTYR